MEHGSCGSRTGSIGGLILGPIVERENQENVVEIRWGTNCQDNLNAHGFLY